MPRFLSPEWVEAFNQAVADIVVDPPGPEGGLAAQDGEFSFAQVVTGVPHGDDATAGEVRIVLRVSGGRASMTAAPDAEADVTVRLSWDAAMELSLGTLSPNAALAEGRIRVRGDLSVLSASQGVLAALQPALATLRDQTEY